MVGSSADDFSSSNESEEELGFESSIASSHAYSNESPSNFVEFAAGAETPPSDIPQHFEKLKICGVKEGTDYKYDASEVTFGYCEKPIDLYGNGAEILFEDFAQTADGREPKTRYPFFDRRIISNLKDIKIMRPAQIAAFQATCFNNDSATSPSDFLGISSTGTGKTHAFLVPIVQKCLNRLQQFRQNKNERTPFALIFAHSNTLVQGIKERADELIAGTGLDVRMIVGQHDFLQDGNFDIAVCSIGRFANHFGPHATKLILDLKDLEYVVIDEADKMAETEGFFSLFRKMKEEANFATMCFSATINMAVMDYIDTTNYYQFCFGEPNAVALSIKQRFWEVDSRHISKITGVATGNIRMLEYAPDEKPHPFDVLYYHIKNINSKEPKKRCVVFVKRTCVADFIAQKLTVYGIQAVSVYSESFRKANRISVEKRNRLLKLFVDGEVHVLVATQLLTRGTDMEVDYVINYDLPLNYLDYIHRCGRTGRNQKSGTAITFVDLNNKDDYSPNVLRQIVLNTKEKLPKFLQDYAETVKACHEDEMKIRKELAQKRGTMMQ